MKKTWSEFWGEFLLIQFHKDNPNRWTAREKRAEWIVDLLKLKKGSSILELGCGDGLLDICLGRLGMNVTGVDRLEKVLQLAESEVEKENVVFLTKDLRELDCREQSWDAIIIIETIGLMSIEDDIDLIARSARWLKPGGAMIIDCPKALKENHIEHQWDFPNGRLIFKTHYEPETRIQKILPTFTQKEGTQIKLFDPYDKDKGEEGVRRYLYPLSELTKIMRDHGLLPEEIEHFSSPDHYALAVHKPF